MNKNTIIKISFISSILLVIVGAYLKITHSEYADVFLSIGLCLSLVFTVIALYEIHSSKNIPSSEKVMWTIGFIFMNTLAALLYFLVRRHVVLNPHRATR